MSIFIIADLHLSFSENKPMDIFGENWSNHADKIRENWIKQVREQDLVLICGDFSWAMSLKDTYEDFKYLNELPGEKILLKGNHDYWWTTITSMKKYLEEKDFKNIDFLQNKSYLFEDKVICGTRGWSFFDIENSEKMINREIQRLELSLQDGVDRFGKNKEFIVVTHYPLYINSENTKVNKMEFINLMKKYNVKKCFYGHLHGKSHKDAIEGNVHGIEFKLVSADYLDFKLYKII